MIGRILTPWTGDGKSIATAYRPRLLDDHPIPAGASCTDATGQPVANILPSPNLFTVEVGNVTQAWLDAVAGDATYQVLWAE